jgi:hypothetical protein
MKQRISSLIVPSLIIPVFLLSGCGTAHVTTVCAGEAPTVLHILRVNTIPLNHYLPFSPYTLTNPLPLPKSTILLLALLVGYQAPCDRWELGTNKGPLHSSFMKR